MSKHHDSHAAVDLVYAYLDNRLSLDERRRFRQRLETEAELRMLLHNAQMVRSQGESSRLPLPSSAAIKTIEERIIHNVPTPVRSSVSSPWKTAAAVAAAAGIALAVLSLLVPLLNPPTPDVANDAATAANSPGDAPWRVTTATLLGQPSATIFNTTTPLMARTLDADAVRNTVNNRSFSPGASAAVQRLEGEAHTAAGETRAFLVGRNQAVLLMPATTASLTAYASSLVMIHLIRGGVEVIERDELLRPASERVVVRTDDLVVVPRGTRYRVELKEGEVALTVTEGRVIAARAAQPSARRMVSAGQELTWRTAEPLPAPREIAGLSAAPAPSPSDMKAAEPASEPRHTAPAPGAAPVPASSAVAMAATPANPPSAASTAPDGTGGATQQAAQDLFLERFFQRVRNLMSAHQWSAAQRMLTDYLAKPDGDPEGEGWYLLGMCYERQGEQSRAVSAYTRYLRDYPLGKQSDVVRSRLDVAQQALDSK